MTRTTDTRSPRPLPMKLAAGLVLGALVAAVALAAPASADGRGKKYHNWNGGYYRAPPIIYGSPYGNSYYGYRYYEPPRYYPPPIIYGPGLNFNFQVQ